MNELINSAEMTADQATDYLASMGVDAEVKEVPTTTTDNKTYMGASPIIEDTPFIGTNPLTGREQTYHFPRVRYEAVPMETEETKTTTATTLQVTSARKASGGNFKYKNSSPASGTKKPKSSSGGSSKKPKTTDTTRYHEINSKLEQTSHYLDMVNTAEDRAYGQKKLDLMDEKIKLLEREAEQYKQLYNEAKRYYDQDRDRLQNQYGAAFNADGSIANYDA